MLPFPAPEPLPVPEERARAGRRPRRPVLAADRPSRPRGARVLGARRPPLLGGRAAREEPRCADPLRRAGLGLRGQRAAGRSGDLRARRAGARHLLRHAADGAGPRRTRRARCGRVRQDGAPLARSAGPGSSGRPDGLDEPPRLRDCGTARGRGDRRLRRDPDRRLRGARPEPVRRPVPPGGRAHAARPGGAEELPLRRRRRAAHLDARGRDRGAGRADPRPGREGARAVRAVGRRRLRRRCAARAQGGRRPADLCLRRPRPAPQGRGRSGGRDLRGPLPRPARPRRRGRPVPLEARGRDRAGAEAPDRRRGVHPRLRGGGGDSSARRASSSRGRSTRT